MNQIKPLTQSDNSIVKEIVNNQTQFIQHEIENQTIHNNLSVVDEDGVELPVKYYENRLMQLYTEQQQTKNANEILDQTNGKLTKKEKKEQQNLSAVLTSKENYLQKEIAAIQAIIENQKQSREALDDLQDEFYELEAIIIKLPKVNAEQLTLYEVLNQELKSLEKLYVQKAILENQLVVALNESDKEEITKIATLIRQNKELRSELEKLTTSTMHLLKSEIESPTKTLVAAPPSIELQKEVAEVAFTVHPQDAITTDQIKTILDSDNYPKGLFFRVQVGAFAKPINENVYRDFSPITMENLNKGLIKYMAGYFTEEAVATIARDQIRQLGFKDAFLVAYCDGRRIPVYEARRLLAEGICLPVTTSDLLFHIDSTKQQLLAKVEAREAITLDNIDTTPVYQATKPVMKNNTLDATSVKDLYFTVQIGVFNRYVEKDVLKGLNPINTDELNPKTIRYSVGVFDDLNKAKDQRVEAVQKGFTDAFVVAYYQGKRITVQAANALLTEGNAQFVKLNEEAKEIAAQNPVVQQEVNYIEQLKVAITKSQETKNSTNTTYVNDNDATNITSDIQFTVSTSTLNLVFYWWITHNFNHYTLQKVNNSITVYGYCDKDEKENIISDFQALKFLNVNIVK